MAPRARLDAELVRRGLARSRDDARSLIGAGLVTVAGTPATKPSTNVGRDTPVLVSDGNTEKWASRGAHKLIGALEAFGADGPGDRPDGSLEVAGRRCLDAGASTGGFTDVLLRRGAREVIAADVGYGQLVWRLQTDARVTVADRVNARHLDADSIGGPVDLVVADLSFISLRLVLPAFARCVRIGGDVVPMVKPQFEVGKDGVGSGGVVRDPALRRDAVRSVAARAGGLGLRVVDAVASPLPGPSGNVEYFLWLRGAGTTTVDPRVERGDETGDDADAMLDHCVPDDAVPDDAVLDERTTIAIDRAVEEGPQ